MSSSSLRTPSRQDSLLLPSNQMARVDGRSYRGSSNMTTFGIHNRHGNYYYDNYISGGGGGIEFRAHTDGDEPGGVTSPPLWKTSPCTSPPEVEETTPLRSLDRHQHYRLLSPTSRSQAIAKGRQELMEMVKNMPESSYELSLKDLVDHSKVQQGGFGESTACVDPLDTESFDDSSFTIQIEKKKKLLRSRSINSSGPILLKLVFPTSLGRKKKKKSSLSAGTCAKVSPKPVVEGDKDKDWWKKRASVASAETETNGSSSSGSSNSNSSSRNKGEPGCWSVFYTRKNKTTEQRDNRF